MESGISEQKPIQTNHYRADDDDDDDTAERISRSSSQGLCVLHSVLPQFMFWLQPSKSLILESVHNQFGATDATILDFEHLDCKQSNSQPLLQKSDALSTELSHASSFSRNFVSWSKWLLCTQVILAKKASAHHLVPFGIDFSLVAVCYAA